MDIHAWYVGHLSEALDVGPYFKRREKKMPDILLHSMETQQVIYQKLQIKIQGGSDGLGYKLKNHRSG